MPEGLNLLMLGGEVNSLLSFSASAPVTLIEPLDATLTMKIDPESEIVFVTRQEPSDLAAF